MDFSPQQAKALSSVSEWYNGQNSTPQVFRLFGYAGTGKTTLARHLVSQLDCSALFAAYTGKAASVLKRKGCNATTIHALIYAVEQPNEELVKSLKKRIAEEASPALANILRKEFAAANSPKFSLRETIGDVDLIVIDEVSMVGEQIGNDLLSFGKKILVLGDPAQLPPIEGGGFFTNQAPDILLTEIHRQAAGNPIIAMATIVRQGGRLKKGSYGSCVCIDRSRTGDYNPSDFEQFLVGRNATRKSWNTRYRDLFGWVSSTPEQGEKLICLKNNKERGLLNGTQWRVKQGEDLGYGVRLELFPWEEDLDFEKEGTLVEAHNFSTDIKMLEWYERNKLEEFDFGYAITCHKAQGSQWKNGFIADESYCFRENSSKWLYTALTRFEENIVVSI